MRRIPAEESWAERLAGALMLVGFWAAFAALAVGLALWIANHGSPWAPPFFAGGLLGLMLLPVLRLVAAIATAHRERDWLTFASTLAVLVILFALTLRDASGN